MSAVPGGTRPGLNGRNSLMKNEPTNTDNARYSILRGSHVVFVLKQNKDDCFSIAFPAGTTDEKALQMASEAPGSDWRKVETISLPKD